MLRWSAICFCIAILAAVAGLSGTATLPFELAVILSLAGFVTGVILIFARQKPPEH